MYVSPGGKQSRKRPPLRTISAGGIATGGGDLSANRTITVTAAVQSDQETATSTTVAVVPAIQQNHPSAAKFWANADVSGASSVSYNLTSTADTGAGLVTWTIATDFSSAAYSILVTVTSTGVRGSCVDNATITAGVVEGKCFVPSTNALSDPSQWFVCCFGDQ